MHLTLLTVFYTCFRLKLENDPLNLGQYLRQNDSVRYVDIRFFNDHQMLPEKFSKQDSIYVKQHVERIAKSLTQNSHSMDSLFLTTKTLKRQYRGETCISFAWFCLIMLQASPIKIIRNASRLKWVKHWFADVPNSDDMASYVWNSATDDLPAETPPIISLPRESPEEGLPAPQQQHPFQTPQHSDPSFPTPLLPVQSPQHDIPQNQQAPIMRLFPPTTTTTPVCLIQPSPSPSPVRTPPAIVTPQKMQQQQQEPPTTTPSPSDDQDSAKRGAYKNTKEKQLSTFIEMFGLDVLWLKLLARIANDCDTTEPMINALKHLDKNLSRRRKKITPIIAKALNEAALQSKSTTFFNICMDLFTSSGRRMLATIRSSYGQTIQLPSDVTLKQITNSVRIDFMRQWGLTNLPRGMRVSLVLAVRHVAKFAYGVESLTGLLLDIWGDGMLRGKHEITRLCFRIIGSSDPAFNSKIQSRNETFSFAVFYGKDSRINMEINLGSHQIVGDRGWLYDETKQLFEEFGVRIFFLYMYFY